MDKRNIITFALLYLNEHVLVDEYLLRDYIRARPEVGKALPLQEIRDALNDAYQRKRINLVYADKTKSIYTITL